MMLPELSADEIKRYKRHIMIQEVGEEGQRKLKASSALVVGVGGLGSPIALYLAAAGVGRLGLIDGDNVDVSNLQRQVLYSTDQIGKSKTEQALQRLHALNPHIQIDAYADTFNAQNALQLAGDYDVLVDGSDNLYTRYLLNDAAVLKDKPYVYGSIYRFEGQVSVFHASHGPCYRCLFSTEPPPGVLPNPSEVGVFGMLPGTVGTMQAAETLKLLLGIGTSLIGRLLLYDALEMSVEVVSLRKNGSCPICGVNSSFHRLEDDPFLHLNKPD
jgi:adenylyltransferase/sulfurtransferase